jgi:heme exporter protein C
MKIAQFSNPARFMALSDWLMPTFAVCGAVLFAIGIPWALFVSPADWQQGDSARIMYIHVPSAWWGMGLYAFMAVASFVSFVWRHALADVAARAAAPVGAALTGLCLVTGAIWGYPTWGTWWAWDARLTSVLVLFLIYLGYMAVWAAVEDQTRAARLAAILCMVGAINLPIIRMSVYWWDTLHQPSSVIRAEGPAIHYTMLYPLLTMALAFLFAAGALVMSGMRAEIYRRRSVSAALRQAAA